jgi:GntR family transcriptional regulator
VIPFRVTFRAGASLYEQVVYASVKAMVSGQLRPGDAYPSVRVLSRELKINPNTAHKVVAHLVGQGFLETRPGIGTVVAQIPDSSRKQRAELLGPQIEELVVEAKRLGVESREVVAAIDSHWERLSRDGAEGEVRKEGGRKR